MGLFPQARLVTIVIFCCFFSFGLQADPHLEIKYKLRSVKIEPIGAMDPMPVRPHSYYLRWAKFLCPTTSISLINRYLHLTPGSVVDCDSLLRIKNQLCALPYFSTVSVEKQVDFVNNAMDKDTAIADIRIQTTDQFPITFDLDLHTGPLLTIAHNNLGGYGHSLRNQLFIKKRWGYGCIYEVPCLCGNYLIGGQWYRQKGPKDFYIFDYQNLWIDKLFRINIMQNYGLRMAIGGSNQYFKMRPDVIWKQNRMYDHHRWIVANLGWVVDQYQQVRGVYSLGKVESLPKGGSVDIVWGYQRSELRSRYYVGMYCIKNITAGSVLQYCHLACKTATFINKKRLEEIILRLTLDCVGPLIFMPCNHMRQFICINFIMGARMPWERKLGIYPGDPEALEEPNKDNLCGISQPINARFTMGVCSTLHLPIAINCLQFAFLGCVDFIALYGRNHKLLNATIVQGYGLGLLLEHRRFAWPTLQLKLLYSPLWGKVIPFARLSICSFKNKQNFQPRPLSYT